MSIEAIEREIETWDESQLTRLVNRAVAIRSKFRQDFLSELSAKLDDPDPSRWVSLDDAERRFGMEPERGQ
jgi:hypothetical protein